MHRVPFRDFGSPLLPPGTWGSEIVSWNRRLKMVRNDNFSRGKFFASGAQFVHFSAMQNVKPSSDCISDKGFGFWGHLGPARRTNSVKIRALKNGKTSTCQNSPTLSEKIYSFTFCNVSYCIIPIIFAPENKEGNLRKSLTIHSLLPFSFFFFAKGTKKEWDKKFSSQLTHE